MEEKDNDLINIKKELNIAKQLIQNLTKIIKKFIFLEMY